MELVRPGNRKDWNRFSLGNCSAGLHWLIGPLRSYRALGSIAATATELESSLQVHTGDFQDPSDISQLER